MSRIKNVTGRARTVVGVVCAIVILTIAGGYAAYFRWSARGDLIDVAADGHYGWGDRPMRSHDGQRRPIIVGTYHCYFFVRDGQHFASGPVVSSMP